MDESAGVSISGLVCSNGFYTTLFTFAAYGPKKTGTLC